MTKIKNKDYVKLHNFLKRKIEKLQKKAKKRHQKTLAIQEKLATARSQLHKLIMGLIEAPEGFNEIMDEIIKSYEKP